MSLRWLRCAPSSSRITESRAYDRLENPAPPAGVQHLGRRREHLAQVLGVRQVH